MKPVLCIILLGLLVSACGPQDALELPTLAQLDSGAGPDATVTALHMATEKALAAAEPTTSPTSSPTERPTVPPTAMPTATVTASRTPDATTTALSASRSTQTSAQAALTTATAAAVEAPVLSTFTPAPPGSASAARQSDSALLMADVVITEAQFQEEVNRLIAEQPVIRSAAVDFVDGGVAVALTAAGSSGALTTGTLVYIFQMMGEPGGANNVVAIQPQPVDDFIMAGGGTPTEAFIEVAYGDLFATVFEAFDFILNQRLGQGQHNLEFITIDDEQMAISLFVPK